MKNTNSLPWILTLPVLMGLMAACVADNTQPTAVSSVQTEPAPAVREHADPPVNLQVGYVYEHTHLDVAITIAGIVHEEDGDYYVTKTRINGNNQFESVVPGGQLRATLSNPPGSWRVVPIELEGMQ